MEESLKKDFRKKICILCENKECNCKNNIIYEQIGDNFKRIYCLDYKTIPKNVSKRHIRESILDENDKIKHILMM